MKYPRLSNFVGGQATAEVIGDGSAEVGTGSLAGVTLDDDSTAEATSNAVGGLDGAGSVTVGSVAGADLTEGEDSGSAGADAGAFVDVDGDGWGEADAETSTSLGIEGQDPATANADASGYANGAASSGVTRSGELWRCPKPFAAAIGNACASSRRASSIVPWPFISRLATKSFQ